MYERSRPIIDIANYSVIMRFNLEQYSEIWSRYYAIFGLCLFFQYVQFRNLTMFSISMRKPVLNATHFQNFMLYEFKRHGLGLAKIAFQHVLLWARCGLTI